jgi:hypothetical protein
MSKPRWRWATGRSPLCGRFVWTRKPYFYKPYWYCDGAIYGIHYFTASRQFFLKHFGRDLRPGEIRSLP